MTKQKISYPAQFALLLALIGVAMVLGSLLVAVLGSQMMGVPFMKVPELMVKPQYVNEARLLNTLGSFFIFFLPAILFARMVGEQTFSYLGFNKRINHKQLLLVLFLTFAGMILSGALGSLNELIPLSPSMLRKAKALEEAYKAAMMSMATMRNTADLFLSLLVLAAAPALFEEVLFRGTFQQLFVNWTRSPWVGILLTSLLFSAVHFSYFGFLPRVALGVLLGLIFYYSKNVWLSIFLHFLNNAVVVVQLYVLNKQGKPLDKAMEDTVPLWWGAIALALIILLFYYFRKESKLVLQEKPIV